MLCSALMRLVALALLWTSTAAAQDTVRLDTLLSRYAIDSVDIPTADGTTTISAYVVRPRNAAAPLPAIMRFSIYARPRNMTNAVEIASKGFAGVYATARGKRRSAGPVSPYEHDGEDAHTVIDWISRQPWNNGSVGFWGGSYEGYVGWSAAKRHHPALKTIVASASVAPGIDVPMENGIFLNYTYSWVSYVTNNNMLDSAAYGDRARWFSMDSSWFVNGLAYRSRDSVDGKRNEWFQRWIAHPTYDAYWRAKIPYGSEFSAITIPVLATSGYFDGGQIGVMYYLKQHYRHNPHAEHYLLIGPWDHFGSQGRPTATIAGYETDSVARVDITGLIFEWFAHVLRGGPRPRLIADRINYQVMGRNEWRHAPSLAAAAPDTLTFHLNAAPSSGHLTLSRRVSNARAASVTVDMFDRETLSFNFIEAAADTVLDTSNGVAFVSAPLPADVTVTGSFIGKLSMRINKRDVDIGVRLYARTVEGRYLPLSYFLGRASHARDWTTRQLLRPGVIEDIPFTNTRMTSRFVPKGSRIVAVLNVNKNPATQTNYGSGKDVSLETLADGGAPLRVEWFGTSCIKVPVTYERR